MVYSNQIQQQILKLLFLGSYRLLIYAVKILRIKWIRFVTNRLGKLVNIQKKYTNTSKKFYDF